MLALQDVGESLVDLEPRQFEALRLTVELPERLVDAIREARSITAHGARKRQMQYVGRLMREVEPEPILRWLDAFARGRQLEGSRQRAIEEWRDRLLDEPQALDDLAAAHAALDRERMRALIARAREERSRGLPPHSYRDLFRSLKALLDTSTPRAPGT